jgi:signal transduction histidine kinase
LHQYAEQLAVQNAELDAFAHTVAHDLKGLLSVILGYTTVLADDAAALARPDWGASLTSIIKTAQRMNSVIEALLLLAATRQGQIESEPLDMAQIVAEAQDRQSPMIAGYQAEIALPANWPVALGVAPWVEEVWINYLSNALKYGGQPPRVELGATTQANGQVRFWVRDHGLGIAPEAQARLFAPFTRLRQVSVDGHGLGLSIVRRIVEKLGGEVGVESALGQGNVFFFTLPLATSPDTLAVRIEPINLSP